MTEKSAPSLLERRLFWHYGLPAAGGRGCRRTKSDEIPEEVADRTYLPAFLKRSFWKPFSITVLMQVLVLRKPLNMVASAL